MSRTQYAVCLLALAGGATLFISAGAQERPVGFGASSGADSSGVSHTRNVSSFSIPITFEPSTGPGGSGVQFVGRGKGLDVFLTGREIAIALPSQPRPNGPSIDPLVEIRLVPANAVASPKRRRTTGRTSQTHGRRRGTGRGHSRRARSRRKATSRTGGAEKPFSWRGEELLAGRSNYLIGNNPRTWRTQVPHYTVASTDEVLPGVGMKIYGNGEGLEYDLRLKPRVDPSALRLEFAGARGAHLAANGDLMLDARGSELRVKKPVIYEELPGAGEASNEENRRASSKVHKNVQGSYELHADGSVGFAVGPHDAKASLVIDPSLSVTYATFLGGSGSEAASSVALDSSGNIYIGGTTTSPRTFPEFTTATVGPGIGSGGGSESASSTEYFVAKINPNASGANSLVYLTFLGGSLSQSGALIAVDASGDVEITGTTTSPDFPVTDGSTLTSGANDTTVSEIDPTGSALLFSTLFGGSGAQSQYNAGGIALDAQGRIYVASDTSSQDLAVTAGAFQPTFAGGSSDGFLAIFEPGGSPNLTYCSYLGANASAQFAVGGVAVDASGNAYIAGFTSNGVNGFPTKNAFQTGYGGDPSDAFLMKILPAGQGTADVIYATLLGGSGLDEALAVAVDNSIPANAYVTGTTQSSNFPTNGAITAYQPHLHAGAAANGFLSVIAQNPSTGMASLAYSTYIGGSATDAGAGVTATAFNSVYVTGAANSWDFPWHDNLQPFNGASDGFVAKFDPSAAGAASLIYATPLGGTAPPGLTVTAAATSIAADRFGDVYVAGQTTASDFPTALTTGGIMNGFQPICASCQMFPAATDAFLVGLRESAMPEPSVYFNIGSVVFPAQPIGTQNTPQPVAVHNGGESPLSVSSLQITGANSQDFSLIGPAACQGQTIPVGGQCSFEVGFVPSISGPEGAVVSLTDNAPGSPQLLELIGLGQGASASLSTTSLNFGSRPENTTSLSLPITITNTGNQALTLQSPVESGPDVAQFFLSGKDTTCGTTLAAGASCSIGVVFSPKAIGTFHAQVAITDNFNGAASATQTVSLTGTATGPAPVVTITPGTLAFGTFVAGASSGAPQVTLSNSGSAALNITGITLTGANASDFAIVSSGTNQCQAGSGSLAAGASCAVSVRFVPAAGDAAGVKSAALSVTDNGAGSPQVVSLTGTATVPPAIQISPASLNFAPQSVGVASPPQTVTVLNASASSLSVNGISITGTSAGDFTESDNCPPSLRAGASCSIGVVFTPAMRTAAGRSAVMNVADNAAGSPQAVSLTGTATVAAVTISPASINFGSQLAGTSGSPQTITVTNNGAGALAFSSTALSAGTDFVVGTNTCQAANVSSGGTCTLQITFNPACTSGGAARSATLVLTDNVAGSPQSVPLTGTATGDFCFASSTTATVASGQTAVYSLTVNSPTAYKGSVSLACGGTPSTATCTTPGSVAVPAQFTVSVATAANSTAQRLRTRNGPGLKIRMIAVIALPIVFLVLAAVSVSSVRRDRRRRHPERSEDRFSMARRSSDESLLIRTQGVREILRASAALRMTLCRFSPQDANPKPLFPREAAMIWGQFGLAAVALFALSFWIAGCGGGSGGASGGSAIGTPAGTYSLTLTGQSANTTAQITLTLKVQ